MKSLDGLTDDEVNKITHLNVMRHYRYDPFASRGRERCTVGALRAEAIDVDLAPHRARKRFDESGTLASDLASGKIHGT